jgi:predicted DCC family thiol-disulfide oxidoreductase YuxK
VNHLLRIDPRSLGLFRVLFGLALLGDLRVRYRYALDFYSNEGVLPNHNHLFNLKSAGRFVWSALHSFSSPGEAEFALLLIGLFYVLFTLGVWTRAMTLVSLVSLVSLVARNTLAEGPGDWLAIALLAFGSFVPLGSRFSVDAVVATLRAVREAGPAAVGARDQAPTAAQIEAHRLPGWSPRSVASLGLQLQLALVLLTLAITQRGAWRGGAGLARALDIDVFASPLGHALRGSPLLGALSWLLLAACFAVPALLLVPVVRGPVRLAAAALLVAAGLVYGLLTNLGLFGWSLVAGAALVVSDATWDAWATRGDPARALTVIYDDDCGVCSFTAGLLERLDTRGGLSFRGSSTIGAEGADALPSGVTPELASSTVIALRKDGAFVTRGEAVSAVLGVVPGFGLVAAILRIPGVSSIAGALYDAFATRRTDVSVELGLAACGTRHAASGAGLPTLGEVAPATRQRRLVTGALREALAAVFLLSVLAQTTRANELGVKLPQPGVLESVSWWSRTQARWGFLAPEPPAEQGRLVTDGLTRDDRSIDAMTGRPPSPNTGEPFALGAMWARYSVAIAREENRAYQAAFRTYLGKRGPAWTSEALDDRLNGVDAYWATAPATPGTPWKLERMFRQGRGGKTFDKPGMSSSPASSTPRSSLLRQMDAVRPTPRAQPGEPAAPAPRANAPVEAHEPSPPQDAAQGAGVEPPPQQDAP